MSLHRPSGNVVNRVNNNKYHPSTDAPQELDKWYTHHDIPQLNGTGSTSLSYKPHPQESSMMEEADKGGANDKHCPSTDAPQEPATSLLPGNIPQLNGTGSTSLSYKPHPNKGGANDKSLPLDEAPPQEPAKKKARTSFAIPSSQVTDLSTDVEVQPPPMKEKKSDDVAGAALTTLLDRQEFVDVLDKNVGGDPERRKMASRHLCAFCSCHINTLPNTQTPIPSDVKVC